MYLILDSLYHKLNPLFTTFVDGSIFEKMFKAIISEKKEIVEDITFTQLLQ